METYNTESGIEEFLTSDIQKGDLVQVSIEDGREIEAEVFFVSKLQPVEPGDAIEVSVVDEDGNELYLFAELTGESRSNYYCSVSRYIEKSAENEHLGEIEEITNLSGRN